MKVLILAFGHPDNVFSLSHHLSKKVDLTVIFCISGNSYQNGILELKSKESDSLIIKDKKRINELFPKNIIDFVNDDFRLWIFNQKSRKIIDFQNLYDIFKLSKALKKEKFDVIHYNGASGFLIPLYFLNSKSKQFWTLHDYKAHSGEENKRSEQINRFIVKRNRLTTIQHYEYLRKEVISYFKVSGERVRLLRSGPLDILKTFSPKYIVEGDYILFFGRISKYKGVDTLLKAYSNIKTPSMKLVIAGKGNFWFDISRYLDNENIIFINRYIKSGELVGLIRKSKFIITPYTDATHSAVIMSSFVFNKPVVSTELDGITEVIKNNYTGILFAKSENSKMELMAIIKRLMNNTEELKRLSLNIKKEKEIGSISWSKIIDNYYRFYTESQ
jgi:glycosyltransferase involved in cell wall biosynthesis